MTPTPSADAVAGIVRGLTVDGVRMDRPRACWCGRRPTVSTGYDGFKGSGPFLVMCEHGRARTDHYVLSRSWYKSRAVKNWNALIRAHLTGAKP